MAVQISNGTTVPHATDYADFLSKLKTFAQRTDGQSLKIQRRQGRPSG
jgi:hypothetical protein